MLDIRAVNVQYATLRHLHPRWALSEFKDMTVRERRYWSRIGDYMMERKLSLLESGKELLEAP